MRLESISVRNALPVRYFPVENLSEVVVLAGPNGVGKTRLLQRIIDHLRGAAPNADIKGQIQTTSEDERKSWNGKDTLDMESAEDMVSRVRLSETVVDSRYEVATKGSWHGTAAEMDR